MYCLFCIGSRAVIKGHNDVVQLLLDEGTDPSTPIHNGLTPLDYATKYGHQDAAHLILDRGAKPNVANKWGH